MLGVSYSIGDFIFQNSKIYESKTNHIADITTKPETGTGRATNWETIDDSLTKIYDTYGIYKKPRDITLDVIYFTVRSRETINDPDDTTAIIHKEQDVHTNPTRGITEILLTSTDTDAIPGKYLYEIQVKDTTKPVGSQVMTSIGYGTFSLEQDLTKTF